MTTWSRIHTFVAGVALILATNAVALVGVAYNRMGEPESKLVLTQRELGLPYSSDFEGENSGVALNLQWRVLGEEIGDALGGGFSYARAGGTPGWLDKAKLAALGFDVSKPEDTPGGRMHYDKLLPKEALLVLELDGPAYRIALERMRRHLQKEEALLAANVGKKEFEQRLKNAKEHLKQEERENSRLFIVDAGLEVEVLRAKYPDRARYAIVRGQIRPHLAGRESKLRLSGYADGLSIDQINVPLVYRRVFEPMLQNSRRNWSNTAGRSYRASVVFGKRLEPWIAAVSGEIGSE